VDSQKAPQSNAQPTSAPHWGARPSIFVGNCSLRAVPIMLELFDLEGNSGGSLQPKLFLT